MNQSPANNAVPAVSNCPPMPIPIFQVDRNVHHSRADLDKAISSVLDSSQFILGKDVQELEAELAQFVQVPHCITVANGTDALQLALRALNIGPGDSVITVPFSWISSAECVSLVGATPLFVDIDPDTYLMDLNKLETLLLDGARANPVKAVIIVSLFGRMADMKKLVELSKKYRFSVIEDGAQSFGAKRDGIYSCGWPDVVGCTSFFPTKPLGCFGDGGAIFTWDDKLASRLRGLRVHGKEPSNPLHTLVGTNSRLDTIQAAVLRVFLKRFPEDCAKRRKAAELYNTALSNHPLIKVPTVDKSIDSCEHIYGVYTIQVLDPQARSRICDNLKSNGIGFSIYYQTCFFDQPMFAHLKYSAQMFPGSLHASKTVLSLPIGPHLGEREVRRIVDVLLQACNMKE